ncbi:DUF4232 domain-containing protein [Lentzea alba]|uniref:DUF4232 domain-containing protein n=1 Tax=Lentzea alba TaxID=2714351 RepID=UPI0039BF11EA
MRAGGSILAVFAVLAGLVASGSGSVAAPVSPNTPADSCETGLRFSEGDGDAAMGLRVVSIKVFNCGTQPVEFNGYPQIKLFDEEKQPLTVEILDGSGGISQVDGFDDPPVPFTLQPGETAKSAFMWKNRNTSGEPSQNARYLDIAAAPGGTWQALEPFPPDTRVFIDLGDTGRLGVKAWHK